MNPNDITAQQIVRKIAKLPHDNLFSPAANMYMLDGLKCELYVVELYDQITHHRKTCIDVFGEEIVENIIHYCKKK